MATSAGSSTPPSSGKADGKRKLSWGDPNHTKKSPPRNAGVRRITMGGWNDPSTPGPYAYVDINGSKNQISRTAPLLGSERPYSLLLDGFFDVGWTGKHSKHSFKTLNKRHAELICDRIKERCTDLTFAIDLSNGHSGNPWI